MSAINKTTIFKQTSLIVYEADIFNCSQQFPFHKTLESFDFKFQPSIDVKLMRELAGGRYMASGDNVLLLGPPGVGKTHLAVALGIKACEQGVRTVYQRHRADYHARPSLDRRAAGGTFEGPHSAAVADCR